MRVFSRQIFVSTQMDKIFGKNIEFFESDDRAEFFSTRPLKLGKFQKFKKIITSLYKSR